jgi:hypothetical protein
MLETAPTRRCGSRSRASAVAGAAALLVVGAAGGQSLLGPVEPVARVTLRDGRVEEVRNLDWSGSERSKWQFNERWLCCAVSDDGPLQLAVPLLFVERVSCAGSRCTVEYEFRGQARELEMRSTGRWQGKSRTGDFVAEGEAVATIVLVNPPPDELIWGLGKHAAVLTVAGGRSLEADHLLGVYEEKLGSWSTIGQAGGTVYQMRTGTTTSLRHDDGLFFTRAGERRAVGFGDLAAFSVLPGRQVELRAIDGSSAVADLADLWDKRLVGLSGQYGRGFFYVPLESVVEVQFRRSAPEPRP